MHRLSIGSVHLDLGSKKRGASHGPVALFEAGLAAGIEILGHSIDERYQLGLETDDAPELIGNPRARYLPQIAAVCAEQAARVEAALAAGRFPLALGGDHSVAIGTISGIARHVHAGGGQLGLLWIDAHLDLNTPESSPTGNLYGMALANLLGHGPRELVSLAGDRPALDPRHVAAIGIRDVDAAEAELATRLGVRYYTVSELDRRGAWTCLEEALARVTSGTAGFHLSFDLDAMDPLVAPGVWTPEPGGLDPREARLVCETAAASGQMVGMELCELTPSRDIEGRSAQLAVWLILHALGKTSLSGL